MKDFVLKEVKPKIFLLDFKDPYRLSMQFLRYQEYYESASPKFRNHAFTILDFIEWYSKEYGKTRGQAGAFTYPIDWAGFNIPDSIILEVHALGIPDPNKYDQAMLDVHKKCAAKYPNENFYIIGSVGEGFTMKHEIAHGFFYTHPDYKKEMTKLVSELKPSFRKSIYSVLKKIGYASKVYVDECQAYLSTGLPDGFGVTLKKEHKPFTEIYNHYYNL